MRTDKVGFLWDDARQVLDISGFRTRPTPKAKSKNGRGVSTEHGDAGYSRRKEKIFQVAKPPAPDWRPPAVLPEDLIRGKWTIALDLETHDPELFTRGPGWPWPRRADATEGQIVGVAVAEGERKWYFPIAHALGDVPAPDYDGAAVMRYLTDLLRNPELSVVTFNRQYDEGWLRAYGVRINCKQVVDASTACALLHEYRRSYSLDSLGKIYCDESKDESLLRQAGLYFARTKNPKSAMHKIPAEYVAGYAEQDAALTLKLWRTVVPLLRQEQLVNVFAKETALIPILLDMRERGIPVDVAKAEVLARDFKIRETAALDLILKETGVDLGEEGVWTKDPVVAVLEKRKIQTPLDAKGDPTIRKGWLESLPHDPVVSALLEARRLNKVRTTFIEGYILDPHVNGRVYGSFNPLPSEEGGTVTGRMSSTAPNLQNIPARDPELGPLIRGLFLPEPGEQWYALDYSQQEPRLLVHFAVAMGAPGATDAMEEYLRDKNTDFHAFAAMLTGLKRSDAKQINLAIMYGMGGASMCHRLGLPTQWIVTKSGRRMEVPGPEGEAILKQYHERMPFVKYASDFMSRQAENKGEIRTIWGRKCRFTRKDDPATEDFAYPFKALNRRIQGSAADQTKEAMLALYREGLLPLIAIHDELGFSFGSRDQATRAAEVMEGCLPLRVPSKVDIEVGPSWGQAA